MMKRKVPGGDESEPAFEGTDELQLAHVSSVHLSASKKGEERMPIIEPSASVKLIQNLQQPNVGEKSNSGKSSQPILKDSGASTAIYSIQCGSFRILNNAEERVRFFKSLGLDAFSRRIDLPAKGVFYRSRPKEGWPYGG
jgi:hypothetical protein